MNNCFSIYHTSWITSGPKSNFTCGNIPTKATLFFFGCSEVNSTWLITSELANQRARKVLFTCVVCTKIVYFCLFYSIKKKQVIIPSSNCIVKWLFQGCNLILVSLSQNCDFFLQLIISASEIIANMYIVIITIIVTVTFFVDNTALVGFPLRVRNCLKNIIILRKVSSKANTVQPMRVYFIILIKKIIK